MCPPTRVASQVPMNAAERAVIVNNALGKFGYKTQKPMCLRCTKAEQLKNAVYCMDCVRQLFRETFPSPRQDRLVLFGVIALVAGIGAIVAYLTGNLKVPFWE